MNKRINLLLLAIFLIGLVLRLYFVFTYDESLLVNINDQSTFIRMAQRLLQERTFSSDEGRPTAYITPFYPLFLSAIYFLFGYNLLYARIVQAFLGALTCLIVYFITKEIFNRSIAVLAFFLMSIHYFFIRYGAHLLSENLFILLVALSMLYLIKFSKRPSYLYAALFGIFCSLATLTRSAYFLFPFMIMAIFWIMPNFTATTRKKLLRFCLIIVLCVILPISVWTVRNFCVFRSFIPLGTEVGIVLYSAYNPPQGKIFDSSPEDEVTKIYKEMPEVEGSRFLLKQTFLSIKREPSKIYKYIPLKIMNFFSVFDWLTFRHTGTYNFSTAFILPLSFLGLLLILNKGYPKESLILLSPVVYFLFVTIAIMGVPRTRLPVEPYLIILAAFFINYIYSRSRFKASVISVISFWYFFNYLLYLNSDQTKIIIRDILQKLGLW